MMHVRPIKPMQTEHDIGESMICIVHCVDAGHLYCDLALQHVDGFEASVC